MFGREYANHLDILTYSFGEINKDYQKKIKKNKSSSFLIEQFKKLYILIFGIPEIGFQIRNMHFKQIIPKQILNKTRTRILDAGSGIGLYTFWLGKTFPNASVTGGDIDKYKLKSSQNLANEFNSKNVGFIYFDLTKKQKVGMYDLIVIIDVLEHINEYEKVLINVFRHLQKGGFLYIHVPQPNQRRIFRTLKNWHHEDHVHEGITKKSLENSLRGLGFKIVKTHETFGFFGKFAWELNHITLSKSFILTGAAFPLLYLIAKLDTAWKNKNGLGVAILARKK